MLATTFPTKKVQIVETAYNYNYWPSSGVTYDTRSTWPCSVDGQQKFAQDLVAELKTHDNVEGLYWWFPEENGNGGPTWNAQTIVIDSWLNRGLWDNSTHKALPALMELKALCADDAAIEQIAAEPTANDACYSLSGQRLTSAQGQHIYIRNGCKTIVTH